MPAAPPDIRVLFSSRIVRMFAYGWLSVTLALFLAAVGLTAAEIGLLLSLTLWGDTAISLLLTTRADRFGRQRTLLLGALLMVAAGLAFAVSRNFLVLLVAATIGVISPSGYEVGPFLSVEQAALSQVVADRSRTAVFAWYALAGSLATAVGSLAGGFLIGGLHRIQVAPLACYRVNVAGYALLGVALAAIFLRLSPAVEVPRREAAGGQGARGWHFGVARSRGVVLRLSGLFALDAFGGGFVIQSLAAYWFYKRFDVPASVLGAIFFGANIFAGISALLAARLAARFGLVNTMVFTHLPSNVLLILVPLMPNLPLAITVLLLRFSISQMDVPTRQSYVMAVVPAEERAAAAGITGVARSTGAAIAPLLAGVFLAHTATLDLLFYCAGGLKIVYDFLLYRSFVQVRPPEEKDRRNSPLPPGEGPGVRA
jgi:MFS family permease